MPDDTTREELFFVSHNDSSPTTIVLLHGLFSCHLEWEHVIPHLKTYHVLVPDLPQHSQSKHIQPFSLGLAADKVAKLIRNHAHDGKAHVVGLSLGGFVTMEIIRRHAPLVASGFVTGSSPFIPWQVRASQYPGVITWGLSFMLNSGMYKLLAWHAGLRDHDALKREMGSNNVWSLAKGAYGELSQWQQDSVAEVGKQDVRILAVAGGNGDDVEGTKKMAEILQQKGVKNGSESCACVVPGAVHGWDLQFPELFAEGIRAWVEKRPLPEGFEG